MRFDTKDDEFRQGAVAWLQSLADGTITDLPVVFRLSPGYYPTTLAQLWRDEVSRRGLVNGTATVKGGSDKVRLPVCHPGDYEWRFTDAAAAALVDHASTGLPADALVAHVGTPTTFVVGRARCPQLTHALLERNGAVIRSLGNIGHVYQIDLTTDKTPLLCARTAIVDPPWYPADTRAFLWATNAACVRGARIVLCQPTLATRPGVAEERAALLDELPRLGYACKRIDAASVRYRMPHFEASSLRVTAPDLPVPDDWRVGDMLTLEKTREVLPQLAPAAAIDSWHEVTFGPVRIKLRCARAPDLGPLVPGDVLDTVSRRDPIRAQIGLWTSGNRVFSLDNAKMLGELITLCHIDVIRSQFTFNRTLAHAEAAGLDAATAQRLFGLLLIELQEHVLRKAS
jgi:hypothetical protein